MQKDYPSVIELLFEQAISRLRTVIKTRKEAIEHYGSRKGTGNATPNGEGQEAEEMPSFKAMAAGKIEETKQMSNSGVSLLTISEAEESEEI